MRRGARIMRNPSRGVAALMACALTTFGATVAHADRAPAQPAMGDVPVACTPAWRSVPSPNAGSGDNALAALDVISSTDIWAVGNSLSGSVRSTLVEHWNGSAWSVIPSPNGPQPINFLTGVSAVAPDDIWAVGFSNDGNGFE